MLLAKVTQEKRISLYLPPEPPAAVVGGAKPTRVAAAALGCSTKTVKLERHK